MNFVKGILGGPVKVLIYGPEGIGKSTLAAAFPEPVFIDAEGSTKHLDVARFPESDTWEQIIANVDYVIAHPEVCRTLVIDTMDRAEAKCSESMLKASGKNGIEDYGYGKGYVYLQEKFQVLLDKLEKVNRLGIHVVCVAHAYMRKFEQPDELGAYDRWELKLSKKCAPIVKEWADMVLFCNYKTLVTNVDGQGAVKGKNKPNGGTRVIYSTHHVCWDAKNRFGLPDEMPLSFESIASVIKDVPKPEPKWKQLEDIMKRDSVEEFDLQNFASMKGWADPNTPIQDYPAELIDFLLNDWEKVKEKVAEMKDEEEIPFN